MWPSFGPPSLRLLEVKGDKVTRHGELRVAKMISRGINQALLKTSINMAPARRARSPSTAHPVHVDTDEDSEPETPRPHKSTLKKRLSEVHHLDHDASFTSDSNNAARPPLRAVNINDDAAEKRRRRKSTKLAVIENAMAGPSSEGMQEQDGGAETGKGMKQKPLQTVAAPVINVSLDVMSSNFEEWMKMATDNVRFCQVPFHHDFQSRRRTHFLAEN